MEGRGEIASLEIRSLTVTALRILQKYRIQELPFNPMAVARQMNVRVITYESFCSRFGANKQSLEQRYHKDGFTVASGGRYVIVYNQEISSVERQRWTITHELCHILLGHMCAEPSGPALSVKNEREADALTAQLLAPLPVLHFCSVTSAREISRLCGISMQAAGNRLEELTRARRCPPLLRTREDQELIAHFAGFISKAITENLQRSAASQRYRSVDVVMG